MIIKHKWADVIHAWADGKTVQSFSQASKSWVDWTKDCGTPPFNDRDSEWRIKPTEPVLISEGVIPPDRNKYVVVGFGLWMINESNRSYTVKVYSHD